MLHTLIAGFFLSYMLLVELLMGKNLYFATNFNKISVLELKLGQFNDLAAILVTTLD